MPWLQSGWSQLSLYINQNRIPQALLMIGNKGIGKQQLAEQFSQSLMCFSPQADAMFCGKCQSCILFNAKTHPDYIFIAPEEAGKAIGIDAVRQLTAKLALKPQYESYRLVVINPADSLNNASANAFLKYLEEPTERTCLILITDKPSKLPATIRSRCQKLPISVSDEKLAKAWLKQQGVTEKVELLLKMSQGSPLMAKQLFDEDAVSLRTDIFSQWLKMAKAETNFVVIAEQWNKLDKAAMNLLLLWLIDWVADMIKLSHHRDTAEIVSLDLKTSLQEMAERLDLKGLYKYYDFLLLSRKRLDTQLNRQLMCEEILIQWSVLNHG